MNWFSLKIRWLFTVVTLFVISLMMQEIAKAGMIAAFEIDLAVLIQSWASDWPTILSNLLEGAKQFLLYLQHPVIK